MLAAKHQVDILIKYLCNHYYSYTALLDTILFLYPLEGQSSPESSKIIVTNNGTKILPSISKLMLFSITLFKLSSVCTEESCNYKQVTKAYRLLINRLLNCTNSYPGHYFLFLSQTIKSSAPDREAR